MLKMKLRYFRHLMQRVDSLEKTLMVDKTGQAEKGATGDEMVGWHHQLNGHEFGQIPGDSEGQGSLACCSPWGRKESDTTERLNKTTNLCANSLGHSQCVLFLYLPSPGEFQPQA